MKIAIIGSRDFPALPKVRSFVNTLPKDTIIVSGGARGVDQEAARAARVRGLVVKEEKVDTASLPENESARRKEYGKRAYARNTKIVADADEVVAFWTWCSIDKCWRGPKPHRTHGTAHAISEAERLKKPVRLFGPAGEDEGA